MNRPTLTIRALQVGDRIDLKWLEREDAFSSNPLAFTTASGGIPQPCTTEASCPGTCVKASAEFMRSAPRKIMKIIAELSAVA